MAHLARGSYDSLNAGVLELEALELGQTRPAECRELSDLAEYIYWRAGCGAFDVTIGWSFGHVSSRWPVVCERFATDESVSTSHGSSSWSVFFFASTRT